MHKSLLEDFENNCKIKISLGKFDDKFYNKFLKYCIEEKKDSANCKFSTQWI